MNREILLLISVLVVLFLVALIIAPFVALPNNESRALQQPPTPDKSQGPVNWEGVLYVLPYLIPIATIIELLISFIPFVLIETGMIGRLLNAGLSKSLQASLLLNFVTSVIVLPLGYLLYFFAAGVAMLIVTAMGWSGGEGFSFGLLVVSLHVLTALITGEAPTESATINLVTYIGVSLVLLIPAYLLAVHIESKMLQKMFPDETKQRLVDLSHRMNLYSFCALAVISVAYPMIIFGGLY